ncbi:hypothetical protein [Luteolibacter luteus]|uniref:Glycine zipper domain-containing protein n=1 Tax=Luteolibacter luteus TaxID=2728835 RepID=A0A858RCA5_9BACT|nr:hypothetical protein [Luteolibacter luteus]QJE94352.1 hypothetical protein HHL09_00645 [Luteolibacter luteus]
MKPEDTLTPEEREVEGITDTTVTHPVGKTIGATGGALAGAAAGMAAGPVGTAIGAVVGAAIGAAAGHATAAAISPTDEELYWSENHPSQNYASEGDDFEDYRPAYRMGVRGATGSEAEFAAAESELERDWQETRGGSKLDWEKARPAAAAAWDRVRSRQASPEE